MSKSMLIDAAHAEETRVAVVDGHRVEEFDFESRSKKQLRGNIYLAKVTRVEPSLQAAFVEYGGNRHGFLAFNEIHPDYYQIPIADRQAIMAEAADEDDDLDGEDEDDDEGVSGDEARLRRRLMRRYKIQEVLKRRQILLIQVVKEERGTKGAALTTYLSLAGRYCVLMPNTARGGGISRKITNATDRKRLKSAAQALDVPPGMGLIIRTAGAKRTKAEIKRDYDYLLRLWENIRESTLKSTAPALIYEEEDLVKRAIRDMFDKDIDEVLVDGEEGWKDAREFMRVLMPSQAKKVQLYREPTPLFVKYKVEDALSQIHSPTVPLKSGGYLVINQTEALVAVDVNSGRATKERNIEATALKTNLEAADEAARQLRLRDLAGLIVIDFIDMDESKNNRAVEKRLKDALAGDRARVQMGKISSFGLMEISRQRRRSGVLEGTTHVCEHCQGAGRVRSVESSALGALRAVEMELVRGGTGAVTLRVPAEVALYILNEKRAFLQRLHADASLWVTVVVDDALARSEHQIDRTEVGERLPEANSPLRGRARYIEGPAEEADEHVVDDVDEDEDEEDIEDEADEDAAEETSERRPREPAREEGDDARRRGRGGRRRRRGGRRDEGDEVRPTPAAAEGDEEDGEDADGEGGEARAGVEQDGERDEVDGRGRRRRRRGRRGGRRAREEDGVRDPYGWVRARTPSLDDPYVWFDPIEVAAQGQARPERPERTDRPEPAERPERSGRPERGGRGAPRAERAPEPEPVAAEPEADAKPARGRRRRAAERPAAETAVPVTDAVEEVVAEPAVEPVADDEPAPKRRRVRAKKPAAEAAEEPAAAQAELARAPEPEPETAEVVVLEQPVPELELVAAEPDPAEITAPPVQPKRGWWRGRG